ncbi:MAG TPA: SET domain-containing protein [Polyangiaceae bacterium]|jgi:hypothetical protein|nr:SET domain-containing protein [Polyangiaceae bacterium]
MSATKGKGSAAKPWVKARAAREEKELADSKALIAKQTSSIGGNGLFAARPIKKGQLICPVDGARKTQDEVRAAPPDHWWHEYALGASDEGWSMIPDRDVVGWHLANHSCNPSALVDARRDNYLVARRDVEPGQEITFDYGWERFEPMPCHCGEAHCTGNIGLQHPDGEFDPLRVATMMRTAFVYQNKLPFKRFFHAFRGQLDAGKIDGLFDLAFGADKERAVAWMFREGILSDSGRR